MIAKLMCLLFEMKESFGAGVLLGKFSEELLVLD